MQMHFDLPVTNPVLLFSIILFIILFSPLIFNRLKIPHLTGLIVAGAVVGPNGLGLMLRDSSIILYGTVGLLYIMFLAGLEIEGHSLRKNFTAGITFGLLTFAVPMTLGYLVGTYLLGFSFLSTILLASLFASHTLITYPIVGRFGVTKNRAVTIAAGGTVITDTLALLILAVIAGLYRGNIDSYYWIRTGILFVIFGGVVLHGFPLLARWFFKNFDDPIAEYIFVLGLVFLGAFFSELAGVEGIIGAFFTGLAMNRLIPRTSPLMNRVQFVGNALFIPIFLIGVGMLLDYRVFFKGPDAALTAFLMTVTAAAAKYIAAVLTEKIFSLSADERRVIFGLSNSQAAATLAGVLVGHSIITGYDADGNAIRLLNDNVLNGSIVMIFVTCTISAFVTQKGAKNIAMASLNENGDSAADEADPEKKDYRILIPLSNPDTISELVNLSHLIRPHDAETRLFGLCVIDNTNDDEIAVTRAKKNLESAQHAAAAASGQLQPVLRYDINIVHGISNALREYRATDLVLGLHGQKGISDTFLGYLTEGVLGKNNINTLIYRASQPMATVRRLNLFLPAGAEKEIGFRESCKSIIHLVKNASKPLRVYSGKKTMEAFEKEAAQESPQYTWSEFSEWENISGIQDQIGKEEGVIFFLSREDQLSWNSSMKRLPQIINTWFSRNSVILVYPRQMGVLELKNTYLKAGSGLLTVEDGADQLIKLRRRIFRVRRSRPE